MDSLTKEILEDLKQKTRDLIIDLHDLCAIIDLLETEIRAEKKWEYNKAKVDWMMRWMQK